MKIETIPAGALETNCYLVYREENSTLYIIDPGGDAKMLYEHAQKYPAVKVEILLTHAHFDHIGAAGALARLLPVKAIRLAPEDEFIYKSPENCYEPYIPAVKDLPETTGEIPLDAPYEVLSLPGHSPGGRGYLFGKEKALFSGDTLFAGSIGRTDLWGGDFAKLIDSIRNRIFPLDPEIRIYCGHGPATTVGAERAGNPYLQD